MWTAIIVTCSDAYNVDFIQKELDCLVRKGAIDQSTLVLAIEDPVTNIGSGSATLNALVLTTEYLSAKANYQVITADVLENAHILICHFGRQFPFDCCGKGLISLPLENANYHAYPRGLFSNLECIIGFVSDLSALSPPGIWISSTDMILLGKSPSIDWTSFKSDALIISTLGDIEYAKNHGIIKKNQDDVIADIIYRGEPGEIEHLHDAQGNYPIVAGIAFLTFPVAESLLSLHAMSPVDCCTYLGLDSGAPVLQASLYFDILIAMAADTTKESFMEGRCSKSYDTKHNFSASHRQGIWNARKLLWEELHKYNLKTFVLKNIEHCYLSESETLVDYMTTIRRITRDKVVHSHLTNVQLSDQDLVFNSILDNVTLGSKSSGSIIQHCHLGVEKAVFTIGDGCFLQGIELPFWGETVSINPGIGILKFLLKTDKPDFPSKPIPVVIGVHDKLDRQFGCSDATFCNLPWETFLQRTGIEMDELWPPYKKDSANKSLLTARLFSYAGENDLYKAVFWMQSSSVPDESVIAKWLGQYRYSIKKILRKITLDEMSVRRNLFAVVAAERIGDVIRHSLDVSLTHYFDCAYIEGWARLLHIRMTRIAMSFDEPTFNPGKAARTLACIADLMSCMSGKAGGLRSGPASNVEWKRAFDIFEAGKEYSISRGIMWMEQILDKWVDHPSRLMRAARHFEGAAQVLIRKAVLTSKRFICIGKQARPTIGTWVTVECPARVDLQGGWTDTPPICYELGGSVVNLSVLVDNKRPIGARIRRIAEPELILRLSDMKTCTELDITDLDCLKDYQHLSGPGSLLKAAIICAGIIDVNSEDSLQYQLSCQYGSGLEIESWSNLPQGSGLGTSSILAGAVLAALWFATGQKASRMSIIHAVLHVEQLLTTGGGWQDQVGGIMGGINRAFSSPKLPLRVQVERVNVSPSVLEKLDQHLLLLYTGKVRLAKNLLQNVIRSWYARDSAIVSIFKDLFDCSLTCAKTIESGDLENLGKELNHYWKLKTSIALGCNPTFIRELMQFLQPHVWGQTLAGAGGGGFLLILTKEPNMRACIQSSIDDSKFKSQVQIFAASVDKIGITVQIGNEIQRL